VAVFTRAVEALRAAGATVVDPAGVDSLAAVTRVPGGGACNPYKWDLERYLAARGEGAPVRTVREVLRSGNYHPSVQLRLQAADTVSLPPEAAPGCVAREAMRARFRTAVVRMMDSLRLDALVYPTWSNPPRKIGDLNTPHGDNSQLFAPTTGFPAVTVPMGYTRDHALPAGMTFFGRPYSEGTLFRLAYGYEQATRHRRAPASTPPLRERAGMR
jgi:Asp-tRNA(Asn)/Glu-tRNA(Gln) amidotransferase A subunit family amidase